MLIKRTYNHKEFGLVGEVQLEADGGAFKLDGITLPESSVAHLLTFALQTLQDAYAGAKTADEATSAWEKKRTKLIEGGIGTRSSSVGTDEPELMRFIAEYRSNVKAAAKVDAAAYKDATPAERDTMLLTWVKTQSAKLDQWKAVGADLIAADKKRKEEALALGL